MGDSEGALHYLLPDTGELGWALEERAGYSAVTSYRDLRVWRVGMDLVEHVYAVTRAFPKEETYGLTSQIRRAAVSVPSNIAEGYTRESTREYLNLISIAHGSLAELQTQLEIAHRLHYCTNEQVQPLIEMATSPSKQLFSLRNALQASMQHIADRKP